MKTITAIEAQKRGRHRVNLFLDGAFAFSLGVEVVAERSLKPGQMLTDSQIEELGRVDLFQKGLNAALRLLSYRPRSEAEIRLRLRPRFDEQTTNRVLLWLKERKMVDDVAFARFWKENRDSLSPRGKRLLQFELRQKGVDHQLVAEITEGIDEADGAYRAASRKVRLWANENHDAFSRKLGAFLRRRGFDYEVIRHTVERLWQESR